MPTNNFKLFDQNKANLLSDTEYLNSTQRLNGVQTGVASSQLNNKFAYQTSLVAYAIAQIMNQNNLDASDTLSVSAFVGNLGAALLQKVADKASSTEAAAGVLNNKYITPATMKAAALLLSGGTMSGVLNMGSNKITNLGTPTADSDAVTKGYVDENVVEIKPITILENNFENVNDRDFFKIQSGYDFSSLINKHYRNFVIESSIYNIGSIKNTENYVSSIYLNNIKNDQGIRIITNFGKNEILTNVQRKNRMISFIPCSITPVFGSYGEYEGKSYFGPFLLDESFLLVGDYVLSYLENKMDNNFTISNVSGYSKLYLA